MRHIVVVDEDDAETTDEKKVDCMCQKIKVLHGHLLFLFNRNSKITFLCNARAFVFTVNTNA